MKLFFAFFILSFSTFAQNHHLTFIDSEYLNYTRDEISKSFADYDNFWIINDEPGLLVYEGGDCFINWPLYLSAYYFDDEDSLYQINLTLADTSSDDVYLFPEILMAFRNWYGNELDYQKTSDGLSYYYWYFGEPLQEAEVMMFISKADNRKTPTLITQINLKRVKKIKDKKY